METNQYFLYKYWLILKIFNVHNYKTFTTVSTYGVAQKEQVTKTIDGFHKQH